MSAPGLSFKRPRQPSLAPIELLHRRGDDEHSIVFARKTWLNGKDSFEPLCNVPVDELRGWFPVFVDQLQEDSFFSVNGFLTPKKPDGRFSRMSEALPRFPRANRKYVRWLCACYADLDCYKSKNGQPLTEGQAIGTLFDMQRSGQLPAFSMLTLSGRGVWAFWFLRSEEGAGPVRYSASADGLYRQVQKAIGDRLKHLSSDPNARDAARVTRIPGSLHTIAKRQVQYLVLYDAQQRPYMHTLRELADFFGVRCVERPRAVALLRESDPAHKLAGQRGTVGRWAKELRRIDALRDIRGGFPEGCRHHALRLYAGILFRLQRSVRRLPEDKRPEALRRFAEMSDAEIRREVDAFARECRPPLGERDADSAFREAQRKSLFNMKHETIVAQLGVSLDELDELEARGLGGWPGPSGQRVGTASREIVGRVIDRTRRRDRIRNLVAELGKVPTLAEFNAALKPHGLDASERTLMKDLIALGISNPRAKEARKAKLARHPELFDGSTAAGAEA